MKLLSVCLAVLLLVAIVTALGQGGFEKRGDGDLLFCERTIASKSSDKWVELISTPKCGEEAKNKQQQSGEIKVKFSSSNLPEVWYEARRNKGEKPHMETRFAILEIIEYKETNSKAGFQPKDGETAGDEIIKVYKLGKGARKEDGDNKAEEHGFDKPKKETTGVGSDASASAHSVVVKFNRTGPAGTPPFIADLELRGDMTPREVTLKPKNETKPDLLLTPDSFKLTLSLLNIKYNSTQSTGLAVKVAMTTPQGQNGPQAKKEGEGLRPPPREEEKKERNVYDEKKPGDDKKPQDGKPGDGKAPKPQPGTDGKSPKLPAEADKDQSLMSMGSDGYGFFSFNNYVDVDTNTTADIHSFGPVKLDKPPTPDFNNSKPAPGPEDNNKDNQNPNYQIMYFSVEAKPKSMVWDPTLGSAETATSDLLVSSATSVAASLALIVIVALVNVFM